MKLRNFLIRTQRFGVAMMETLTFFFSIMALKGILLTTDFASGKVKVLVVIIVLLFMLAAFLCRVLAIIDHGWKGFFTTYKSEEKNV